MAPTKPSRRTAHRRSWSPSCGRVNSVTPAQDASGVGLDLVPTNDPAAVVRVEWDRGHEEFDAVLRLKTADAVVVSIVHDLWPVAGLQWLRTEEVLRVDLLPPDSAAVRVLDRLGIRFFTVDEGLGDIRELVARAAASGVLVGVHSRRTGSGEMLVGTVGRVTAEGFDLADVSTDGEATGEIVEYSFDDVIGIEWGSDYLRALALLLDPR